MMNFNPLFIGQANTAGTISTSATKLGKSSYLFSDIIKVILEDEADMQLPSNNVVTELNKTNTTNFSAAFLNTIELTSMPKTRIASDFIVLNPEEILNSTDIDEADTNVDNEIDLSKNDLQQLFLSLAGYIPETKAGITTSETEAINKLVSSINKMNAGETISVQVKGLEEQLNVEIKKNDNPLKEFTAKFVIASADLPVDKKIQTTGIIGPELIPTESISAEEHTLFKTEGTTNQKQVPNTPDIRVSNETQPLNEKVLDGTSAKLVESVNKSEKQTVPNHTNSAIPKLTDIEGTQPELKNTPLNNISENEIQVKAELFTKNVSSGTIPVELKSGPNSKEIKTEINPTLKFDSSHTEQKDIKQSSVIDKSVLKETTKLLFNGTKLSPKTLQSENVNRIQTSDTQKVIRLTLNNPEQVNLREVLNSINKGEVKNTDGKGIPKLSFKENIRVELKSEITTKLEQNLVRVNSKVSLDEVITQKPEVKFAKNPAGGGKEIVTVKEDSFAKLSVLNKQVLSNRTFDKSDLLQSTQTSENFKPVSQTNYVNAEVKTDDTQVKSTLTELTNKNKNEFVNEFRATEKSATETTNVKSPAINEMINLTDKIKMSKFQIPLKESAEIKQTIKNFQTASNNSLNKEINVEDKKLSNVQIPVKESTELKQKTKSFLTESKNIPNKEIVVEDKKLSNSQIPVKESTDLKQTTKSFRTEPTIISNKEIVIEDKKLSNSQIPVKESTDLKQTIKSFQTETKNIPNKEIVVEDKKLSNVQVPVKESVRAEQTIKDLPLDSENHLNKDLKIDSLPKESFLKNNGEENNNNSERHNQNNYQPAEAQSFSSAPKDAAHVPAPNNGIGKPAKESVDNSTNEQSSDNKNVELNPKPVVQETNILSKEKIVTETRNMNETVKTIRSSEIVKELTNFVKNGETQTVTFKVVPENLGRIKVSLDVADHVAKATIEVETETVKQIVQSNIESLRQALTHSGITVDAISVSLAGNQQKHYRPVDSKRKMNDNSDDNKIETDSDSLLRKNLGYNTYEYLI